MVFAIWLAQTQGQPLQWVRDWSPVTLSVLAVVGVLYNYVRGLVRLNGYGGRLRKVETQVDRIEESLQGALRSLDRSADDRHRLHERVTEVARDAADCRESADEFHADLAGRITDWRNKNADEITLIRERIKALEVERDIRNHKPR